MSLFFSPKFIVGATLATAALGVATVAEARPEVYFSIGLQSGPVWVEQAPVYVQPRPVYVQPRPVYVQPRPVYVQPQPVYVQPRPVYVQPQPVYVQPAPVYMRPPVFVSPRKVFERPRWGGYDARYEWERKHAGRRAGWPRHDRYDGFRGADRHHDEHGQRRGHRD